MTISYETGWGFATESTYGTPVTPTVWIPFMSESIARSFGYIDVEDSRGRVFREANNLGRESVSGDIEFHVDAESFGYPAFYMLGTAGAPTQPDAGASPTVYEHKLSLKTTDPKFFTSEFKFGSAAKGKKVNSCFATGLGVSIADGAIDATLGVAAQTLSNTGNATAVSFTNFPRPFNFKDTQLDVGANTNIARFRAGEINMAATFVDDYRQGNQKTQSGALRSFDLTGSVELTYDTSDSALDAWLDGTSKDKVVIKLIGDTIQNSYKYEIDFTMPNVWVTNSSILQSSGDLITRSVEFRAFYDYAGATTPDKGIEILLRNKKSSAYA